MREGIRKRLPDRSSVKYVCGIFGWIIFYFIYLLLGGICMLYIERDNDSQLKSESRKKLLEVLSKHNLTANSTATKEIISAVIHASDVDGIKIENINEHVDSSWNIAVAVFFCSTIVTTIGKNSHLVSIVSFFPVHGRHTNRTETGVGNNRVFLRNFVNKK